MKFRLATLLLVTLAVCLALAIWNERRQRVNFERQVAALGEDPWINVELPTRAGGKSYDVGIGTLSVYAQAFFPADVWGTPAATVELYTGRGMMPIAAARCNLVEVTDRQLALNAQLPLNGKILAPGAYTLVVKLSDGATTPQFVTQATMIEFFDALAEQRRQRQEVE